MEDVALGAIQVLRLVLRIDLSGAESDGSAELVADREDQAISKRVDHGSSLRRADESGGLEDLQIRDLVTIDHRAIPTEGLDAINQGAPSIRCHSQSEFLRRLAVNSSFLKDRATETA